MSPQEAFKKEHDREEAFWQISFRNKCKCRITRERGETWCNLIAYSTGHDRHLCTDHRSCVMWQGSGAFAHFWYNKQQVDSARESLEAIRKKKQELEWLEQQLMAEIESAARQKADAFKRIKAFFPQ